MKEALVLLLMFWNVENYFDPFASGGGEDTPFTPRGEKFWTWKKFEKKRDDLAKGIMLVAEQEGVFPTLIGLCEVENRFVLNQLVNNTPLARVGYKVIHRDSPDTRGIDVALLYNPQVFRVLNVKHFETVLPSRLVLYTKGVVNNLDTIHCLVNHWPSKLGGEKLSLGRRMEASNKVKSVCDSILNANVNANIVLMGDFNDAPNSKPLKNLDKLVNLANMGVENDLEAKKGIIGSYKYKESWEVIDQFLVANFASRWLFYKPEGMLIFKHEFLLERDEVYLGVKLRRTLSGPKYLGGVSDHLPVLLRIWGEAGL